MAQNTGRKTNWICWFLHGAAIFSILKMMSASAAFSETLSALTAKAAAVGGADLSGAYSYSELLIIRWVLLAILFEVAALNFRSKD